MSFLEMDIVKGNLDDISRPASVSRSRPESRISSSLQAENPKIFSTVGSLEVLSPELFLSELQNLTSCDDQETLKAQSPENSLKGQRSQSPTVITLNSGQERIHENLKSTAAEQSDSSEIPVAVEPNIDPRLEKAIKRMKALDEILLKKIAKEKEVVAQTNTLRKHLWEELQSVSGNSLLRSHEEIVNTDKFLALSPQFDKTPGETAVLEIFSPVFSTQLPAEECDDDEPKDLQGKSSEMETSERLNQKAKQKKHKDQKGRVDFIQKNIELVKEAGSHVLFMDDEKLRLEQLLADIQDGCSDDDATEVSLDKFGNSVSAPGEQALRCTKELREQKIRLKEIDQQLDDIEQRNSITPRSLSCFSSMLS
ncbi:fibrous sheath-interacting protein 1 isoform X2 [Lithobates pipiens]